MGLGVWEHIVPMPLQSGVMVKRNMTGRKGQVPTSLGRAPSTLFSSNPAARYPAGLQNKEEGVPYLKNMGEIQLTVSPGI